MEWEKVQIDPAKPHHAQVYERVRQMITDGDLKPGQQLPSTHDLARTLGTHVPTVHAAMQQLVREGLVVRQRQRGTFVRQREEKLTCIGVYNAVSNFRDSQFQQVLHAVLKEELAEVGIEMDVWLDPRPHAEQGAPWLPLVKAAENREFQALIATSPDLSHLSWMQKLPIPTAFQCSANLPNAVWFDAPQFAELSLQALVRQGCRSVGMINPMPTDPNQVFGRHMIDEFFERFNDVSHDLGLRVKNEWMRVVHHDDDMRSGGRSAEAFGYQEFRTLWQQTERPEGLVVFPDTVARGVILAAREQQVRVPEELKLVLHKNDEVDLLCPMPVTFVVSSERAVARALIQQVQKQFRGEACELILVPFRESAHSGNGPSKTGAPNNEGSQS